MPMLICYPAVEICTSRVGLPVKGSTGRQGVLAPVAFVIHELPVSAVDYIAEVQRDIPASVLYSNYPRSVHALVNRNGAVNAFVDVNDTAWGLNVPFTPDALATPVFNLNPLNPDALVIHLAFEANGQTQAAVRAMARIICCLADHFNIAISSGTLFTAYQFSPAQDQLLVVPGDLLARSIACDDPLNPLPPPDPTLLQCCVDNTARITALEAAVLALQTSQTAQDLLIAAMQAQIALLQTQVTTINTLQVQINGIMAVLADHQVCIDCVCPPTVPQPVIHYQCSQLQAMTGNNTPRRIDFCNFVSDYAPPVVTPGALWRANLDDSCNWVIDVTLRFAIRNYCRDHVIKMELVTCAGRYVLDFENTPDGLAVITLTGSFVFIPTGPSCDVWIEASVNDDTVPITYIEYADFQARCQ